MKYIETWQLQLHLDIPFPYDLFLVAPGDALIYDASLIEVGPEPFLSQKCLKEIRGKEDLKMDRDIFKMEYKS